MQCLLIFDHLNDVVFSKCNEKFVKHIKAFANQQGLTDHIDVMYTQLLITHK